MLRFQVVLRKSSRKLVFRLGWPLRVLSGALAAFLVYLGFFVEAPGMGLTLGVLSLLGVCYEERTCFDLTQGVVLMRTGLIFLSRRRQVPLRSVVAVRVGQAGRSCDLAVVLADGSETVITAERGTAGMAKVTHWATELAQWLGVPRTTEGATQSQG